MTNPDYRCPVCNHKMRIASASILRTQRDTGRNQIGLRCPNKRCRTGQAVGWLFFYTPNPDRKTIAEHAGLCLITHIYFLEKEKKAIDKVVYDGIIKLEGTK